MSQTAAELYNLSACRNERIGDLTNIRRGFMDDVTFDTWCVIKLLWIKLKGFGIKPNPKRLDRYKSLNITHEHFPNKHKRNVPAVKVLISL